MPSLLAPWSDARLVDRVREGDERAFSVLYERHAAPLLSYCRHMLGVQEEAEDALQQVFASAHQALLRDDRPVDAKPWLYAIARNRCLSMLRARRPQAPLDPELAVEGLGDEVGRRADLRQLVADLRDLPDAQREALVLSELGDLSQRELAGVLETSEANVKGLVHRARSGLIERRDARDASCMEIRAELAVARRGGLRKGRLRHHLAACPACAAYLEDVKRQRSMLAMVLPVVPSAGLKAGALSAAGIGGGAAGSALTGSALKAITIGALATSVAAGGVAVTEHRSDETRDHHVRRIEPPPPRATREAASPARDTRPATSAPKAPSHRATAPDRRRARAARVGAPPQSARPVTGARPAVPPGLAKQGRVNPGKRPATPPGQLRKAQGKGKPAVPPGQAKKQP